MVRYKFDQDALYNLVSEFFDLESADFNTCVVDTDQEGFLGQLVSVKGQSATVAFVDEKLDVDSYDYHLTVFCPDGCGVLVYAVTPNDMERIGAIEYDSNNTEP